MTVSHAQISQTHANYAAVRDVRKKARDWFAGAEVIKAAKREYLTQGKNEIDDDYDTRLALAPVDPLAEVIVETRQSILFRNQHDRSGVKAPDDFRRDVDMARTPDHIFFQRAARSAQVSGMDWILTSKIGAEADQITKQAERDLGLRKFFEHIPGENVLNWRDENGELLWAVIWRQTTAGYDETVPEWIQTPEPVEEFHVWTPTDWFVYRKDEAGGIIPVGEGKHPVGRVPLTPVFGERDGNYMGWPVFRRSIPHIQTLYNLWSEVIWFLRISGHPIPMFTGAHKIEILNTGQGGWLKQEPGDPTPQYGYLEPSGAAHAAMAQTISDLTRRVYAIELRQSLNESRQVASADTRREDRQSLNSSLKTISHQLEAAEKECWDNLSRWDGDHSDSNIVQYNRDFDDRTIEAAFVRELGSLVEQMVVSAETVREVLMRGEVLPPDLDQEEERRRIAAEANEREMPGFGNSAGAANSGERLQGGAVE